MTSIPRIALNDGRSIPQLGFGVFQIDPEETAEAVGEEVREYGLEHGIATEAWSPIARGTVLDEPVVTEVADRVGRTPAQVVLRWHLERGSVVFPKSTTPARIRENFGLFDFALEAGDRDAIDALDRGEAGRIAAHPDAFASVPA